MKMIEHTLRRIDQLPSYEIVNDDNSDEISGENEEQFHEQPNVHGNNQNSTILL